MPPNVLRLFVSTVLIVVTPAAARAHPHEGSQEAPVPSGPPVDYTAAGEIRRGSEPSSPVGAALVLGGGVTRFVHDDAQQATELGGTWDLRVILGTRQWVGLEVAYVGSAFNVSAAELDPSALAVRNGGEATLRLQIPGVSADGSLIEPYGFVGVGLARYDLVNEGFNDSFMGDSGIVGVVPYGGGLTLSQRGALIDLRFVYRVAEANNFLGGADLDSWTATASIGREF